MKTLVLFLAIILSCKSLAAQERQLIVQIPVQTEDRIYQIQKKFDQVEGVHFSGYVKHASCLLFRYESRSNNEDIITNMIRSIDNKISCRIIEGYSAFDIIDGKLKAPLLYASDK